MHENLKIVYKRYLKYGWKISQSTLQLLRGRLNNSYEFVTTGNVDILYDNGNYSALYKTTHRLTPEVIYYWTDITDKNGGKIMIGHNREVGFGISKQSIIMILLNKLRKKLFGWV